MAMTKETRMGHIMNLVSIANADGDISEVEQNFIYSVAQDLELTDEEFVQCLQKWQETAEDDIKIGRPRTIEDRFAFMKNMVLLMMLDGEISDSERQYIANVADQWGLDGQESVDDLITIVLAELSGIDTDTDE